MPQLTAWPQLFPTVPQFFPLHAAALLGVQPHTLAVPPPAQLLGVVQLPQVTAPPQLFVVLPQLKPLAAQTVASLWGTHVQTVGMPWHVASAAHGVHDAAAQPLLRSVGTHFWLQFLVPAGQVPSVQALALQRIVPPPLSGEQAVQPLSAQP